ncbi:MAG: hypothetical protein AVDCRST_MAG35-2162, partial [uncultured Quadrisphaera sp.]
WRDRSPSVTSPTRRGTSSPLAQPSPAGPCRSTCGPAWSTWRGPRTRRCWWRGSGRARRRQGASSRRTPSSRTATPTAD